MEYIMGRRLYLNITNSALYYHKGGFDSKKAQFLKDKGRGVSMLSLRTRRRPEGKIVKPEDRIWKEQFDHLSKDDHLEKLHLLGLDDEEAEVLVEDFEEVKKGKKSKVLQELEQEAGPESSEEKTKEE